MKTLRLNPTDARTWRQNQTVLLDEQGNFVRHLSLNESRALSEVEKKARHLRQVVQLMVPGVGKNGETMVELVATPVQISRETLTVKSKVDGYDVVGGREYFLHQVFLKHGECQVRSHTGQFMKAVRDPNVVRPTAKDAMRNAPRPESCACAGWGVPHVGRHHPICEWNVKAPPEERALPEDSVQFPNAAQLPPPLMKVEKPSILDMQKKPPGVIPPPVSHMAVPLTPQPVVPSPAECLCQKFAKTDGSEDGKHHPVCQWKEAWEAMHQPVMFLMSLSTGDIGRAASGDEIRAARGEQGFVLIGGEQYGVVTEGEARAMKKGAA
jgi:hypothetical protein